MNSRRASLLDLLAWDERARFVIPRWQRQYVWGTTGSGGREVEQLWQDLRANCSAGRKHFCGVMLLHKMPETEVLSWEIVDGQQRMTTFFLLFIAIRDVCEKRGIDFSELNSVFTTDKSDECRLVLLEGLNDDRHVMNALLERSAAALDQKTQNESRIYLAYRYFVTQIDHEIPHGTQEFVLSILQGVDLLILTVDPTDDTRRIFETLNGRGKHIDPDDLVANLINYIGNNNDEINQRAQQVWFYVTQHLEKDDLGNFLDTFGKRNAQQTARGTAFDEIKFEVEHAQKQGRVELWLREFKRAAKNYNEILFPDYSGGDPIQGLLAEIKRLRVPKLNPFLLALLEAFRETPASEPLINNVRSLVVRLLVTYDRPAYRIERFAELACEAFYDEGVTKADRLERVIKHIDENWISDEEFSHAFAMKSIYGPGAHLSRLRYYLEKLEQKTSEDSGQPFEMHFGSKTTVEHVMPQTLNEVWIASLHTPDVVRREAQHIALVDTIGNVTVLLTGDNSAVKNASYSDKKQFYLSPNETLRKFGLRKRNAVIGTCALNRYFENVSHWNFQAIAERSQYLAKLALEIWKKESWNRETK